MTPPCVPRGFTSPRRVQFFFILWAGCLLTAAITGHSVGYPEVMRSKGCRLENKPDGVKAFCSHLSLTSIPRDLPPNTTTLVASYNLITVLQNDSFINISQLTTLNVNKNLITKLEVGTFLPLTKLQLLSMAGNKLAHLQDNIFASYHLLSRLILSNNGFLSVPTAALAKLHQLQAISLSGNRIEKADFTAFYLLREISDIDMKGNSISYLQASDFIPLQNSSLKQLTLANNELESLSPGAFSYLYGVNMLDLQSNSLKEFRLSSFLGNMNITKLSVVGCRIQEIIPLNASSLSSLSNMPFPAIDAVEMGENRISSIPPNAFFGFNQTRNLTIARNKIMQILHDSFCGLDSLLYLDISTNRIGSLPSGMFSCNPRLQVLIVSHNEILILNPMSFHGLVALRKLNLSYNDIKRMDTSNQSWNNPALQVLDISHNRYTIIKRSLVSGYLSNLTILDVSYNKITSYSSHTFDNVPTLRELYLVSEGVHRLNGVFSQMKNLITLDLSSTNRIYVENVSRQFSETASLEELRMCKNNLESADLFNTATQSSLFEGLVSLKKLNLRDNNLTGLEPGVFSPLTKLSGLDLSNANISILKPGLFKGLTSLKSLYLHNNRICTTSADLFSGLDNLESLFLQNNKLRILNQTLFVATPNLRNLYLSGNHLREVQKDTFFPTKNTLLIDVSGNPFSCTCALSWFRTWLHGGNIKFVHPDQTVCSRTSFRAVIDLPILMFNPADFCGISIELITGLSLFASIVAYACVIVYHKRLWLRHKLLLLKLAIAGSGKIAEEFKAGTYDFHLNLMFHDADEGWVDEVMKPVLEERFPHLKNIVYGDEDLRLEMFYINAVYDAIENSFKTVLLLSNRSIDDVWCLTKLRLALEHLNETGLDKVILIFVEDIEDDNLPYLVRLFVRMNKPHMWWSDDEDEQELFWAQFEKSMRANRAITNVIPL